MFLKWLDGNSDGIVTRDEVRMARPDKLDKPYGAGLVFDRLDTNKIGTLDKTRFVALKKRLDWSRAAFQGFVLIGPARAKRAARAMWARRRKRRIGVERRSHVSRFQ